MSRTKNKFTKERKMYKQAEKEKGLENQFGVYSSLAANTKLSNGYDLFDWVMRKNTVPSFWGRSIDGDNPITTEEVEYLRSKKCRIAFVLNDLTEIEVCKMDGIASALKAAETVKALGVPQKENVAIFAKIKSDWSVNHNWMFTFAATIAAEGFVPGFIGNTDSSKNYCFDREAGHYLQTVKNTDGEVFQTLFGATEPKSNAIPEMWLPFAPSDLSTEEIALWEYGKTHFGNDQVAENMLAKSEVITKNLY